VGHERDAAGGAEPRGRSHRGREHAH
jgi:hypothetical protein